MSTLSVGRQPLLGFRSVRLLLIVAVFVAQFGSAISRPAKAFDPLTIGGMIVLGKLTLDKLNDIAQDALITAGEQVRQTIEQLKQDLASLIKMLEETYQNNLNLTIDSLDNLTRNKLLELQSLVDQVNQKLQDDIKLISQETRNVINQAGLQVRRITADLQQRLTDLVVVTSEAAVYIVDRTLFNVILVISLALLGIGLLMFIWLLFSRRLPEGIMRPVVFILMALFVVLFGSMALVPSVRAAAMDATGLGIEKRLEKAATTQPQIVGVDPRTITIGETQTITLYGVALRPANKTVTARIGTSSVPIAAATDQEVALTVSGLTLANGTYELVLLFDGAEGPRAVVEVTRIVTPPPPPDLVITAFSLNPASPVQRGNTAATISVRNQGGSAAGSFVVQWKPFAAHTGISQNVSGLAAGATQTFTLNHSYINAGTVDTVAIVDPLGVVAESNEGNNSRTISSVVVRTAPPRQARVTVTFTQITIHSDADPFAEGELWLDFNIGGQTGRFPSSGTRSMTDGQTININRAFTLTLTEGSNLSVFVNGTDEDSPGFPTFDDHDAMGTVQRNFSSATDWGRGSHSIRSTCPDGCYTISFTISVEQIV
jgi:hypothetical protein